MNGHVPPAVNERSVTAESVDPTETVLRILEMDCADCARRIRDRLLTLDGVEDVSGTPVNRRLRVRYDPARVEAPAIRLELGRMGYAARESGEAPGKAAGSRTWVSSDALRTYLSGALFALGLLLEALGVRPVILPLPLLSRDLLLPGVGLRPAPRRPPDKALTACGLECRHGLRSHDSVVRWLGDEVLPLRTGVAFRSASARASSCAGGGRSLIERVALPRHRVRERRPFRAPYR
jgi:copper chaperone CopZ